MRILAILVLVATTGIAVAQESRDIGPTKVIVGFGPAGVTTGSARIVTNEAGPDLFVIENRPGASGGAAIAEISRYEGDDVVYWMTSVSALYMPPETPLRDIGIAMFYNGALMVLNHGPRDLAALKKKADATGAPILVGTPGACSIWELVTVRLMEESRIPMTPVRYKTWGEAKLALYQGGIDAAFFAKEIYSKEDLETMPPEKLLRPIAETDDADRGWMALFASPKTPDWKIRLYKETFRDATLKGRTGLEALGFEVTWRPAEELAERRKKLYARYKPMAEKLCPAMRW